MNNKNNKNKKIKSKFITKNINFKILTYDSHSRLNKTKIYFLKNKIYFISKMRKQIIF